MINISPFTDYTDGSQSDPGAASRRQTICLPDTPPPPYPRSKSPPPSYEPRFPLCPIASWEKKHPVNRFNCAEYNAILLEEWLKYTKSHGALLDKENGRPWSVDDPVKYLDSFREFLIWIMTKEYELTSKYRKSNLTRDAKGYFIKIGLVYWAYEIHHQNHGGMYTENESVHEVVRQESVSCLWHYLFAPCRDLKLPFEHVAYTVATWAGILLNLQLRRLGLDAEIQPGAGFSNLWLEKPEWEGLLRQKLDDDLRMIHVMVPHEEEEKKLALIAAVTAAYRRKFQPTLHQDLRNRILKLRLFKWCRWLRKPPKDVLMRHLSAGPARAARPILTPGYAPA